MECRVFRLYSNGVALPDSVRGHKPVVGRLMYAPRLKHDEIRLTVFTAQLLGLRSDASVIPVLDSAVLMKVNERGMLLSGQEVIARNGGRNTRKEYYRQAWVIKPIAREADV